MLGIIGAMEEEIAQLKDKLDKVTIIRKADMEFNQGVFRGKEVVLVRSGIGKVNAAICTQILVDDFHVNAIINTGIAGSLNSEINIGDIVLSTDAMQHDMDAVAFGYALGVIPRMKTSIFPADKNLIEKAKDVCSRVNPDISVFTGRIVTGDQFISSKEQKNKLVEIFQGQCTEMEGAAIAQAAFLNNIPFLIIRAISDKADNSASMDYSTFEEKAISHTVKLLSTLIEEC